MASRKEYLPVLIWFMGVVDEKLNLPKNVAKAHWNGAHTGWLLARLKEETNELLEEMFQAFIHPEIGKEREIISECADIAAFAMMIADNTRRKLDNG
jgi:hypothetical protein